MPASQASSASAAQAERIHALDALRAVAMFLGIALHAGIVFTMDRRLPGAGSDVSRHFGFDVGIGLIHGFRMQLFFLLAGFFGRLLHERLGTAGFLKQRLKRIGLPFALSMVTIMPLVIFLALWGFSREGQPVPMPEGVRMGVPTMHLWFLLYLLYLYGGAVVILFLVRRVPQSLASPMDRIFDTIIGSPLRIIAVAPITAIFLWKGPWWGEPILGVFGLTPEPSTLAYYATFFAVGWWLHRRRQLLSRIKTFVLPSVVVALFAMGTVAALGQFQNQETSNQLTLKVITILCAAVYAWSMTFAAIGIFLRFFAESRAWARYMADASYWCYLAHLPVILFLQIMMAHWPWPALIKFTFIMVVTMAALLVTYEYRVRYTWVGKLLNGPRERPKFNCDLVANKEPSPAS